MARLLMLIVILFNSICLLSQKKINQIIIFKIVNDSIQKRNIIKIDENGQYEQNKYGKKTKGKLINFNFFFNEIIKNKKLEYVPPSNNPPSAASMPKKNEQSIYFTIITNDEIEKSKGFNTGSYYSWGISNIEIQITSYEILDSINSKTKKQLIELLKY